MMTMRGKLRKIARIVLVLPFALLTNPATAQSVSDFRLPEPTPTSTGRAAGPVDPENPGASTPRLASDPASGPTPTGTAAPRVNPDASSTGSSAPSPRSAAPSAAATAAPRPAATAPTRAPDLGPVLGSIPGNPNSAAPAPADSSATPSTFPTGSSDAATPSFPSLTPDAAMPPANEPSASWWPYLAAGSTSLAALFGLLWWRRRRGAHDPVVEFIMPVVTASKPDPALAAAIPEPRLGTAPSPLPIVEPDRLTLTLEATRLSASLLATTLSYRLKLINHSSGALVGLAIEGDMVSAHTSVPPEQQIAHAGQALELRHALAALAAGETAEFSGEIRLPLSAIAPIRAGEQAYFVPLARFRIEAGTQDGEVFVIARTFVVGDVPSGPQTTLRPFRLDLGPRTYSNVSQREVT